VNDEFQLSARGGLVVRLQEWRKILGNAFVRALKESFVVVQQSGADVAELIVVGASPTMISRNANAFAQIDYSARIEFPHSNVLARATGVAEGPVPASDTNQ
jgi:hypothetical protein